MMHHHAGAFDHGLVGETLILLNGDLRTGKWLGFWRFHRERRACDDRPMNFDVLNPGIPLLPAGNSEKSLQMFAGEAVVSMLDS